ncbi:MAG: ABC transporter permease [Candidatus Omnitrophica bacterium]|nr:ABC transporter permease [Candidatus Omnitrophota bacterium]
MFFRLFLLMRKEFLQFFRNVPLLIIVLYGATLDVYTAGEVSMDVHNYPIAVYDIDQSAQSREVAGKLREPFFQVTHFITEEKQIENLIEDGKVSVVVVFPKGFGEKTASYQTAQMQVILDGSNSNASELALRYLSSIVYEHNLDLLVTKWKISNVTAKFIPYVDDQTLYRYNPNLIDRWAFCLQEFFTIMTLIGMLLTATAMVNEKQFGTIEQLMVTPLRTFEIMAAKIVPMVVVLFIATFIAVFVILKPIVGVPLAGNVWAFFLVTLIYSFAISGFGLVISTLSNNLSETVLFSLLMVVPIMFLSGAWVPPEAMPGWMRFLVMFSPLKYYLDLGNGIFLKGNSIFLMWKDLLFLTSLGIGAFLLGASRFRKVFQ